jgi:hypothetical protein
MNMLAAILKSGFTYSKEDADITDDLGNTSLYYAAKHANL